MTLFTIFRSPLMFGGDLPSNDEFTLSLLTNTEVLRMHREGTAVRQLFQEDGKVAITSRNAKTNEIYLALFNISEVEKTVKVDMNKAGYAGKYVVKDMWNHKSAGSCSETFEKTLAPHASGLFKLKAKR